MDLIDIVLWSTIVISAAAFVVRLSGYYISLKQQAKEDFLNRFDKPIPVELPNSKYINDRNELERELMELKDLP